ncbi:ROK family protein [Streptomyces sp. NPDC059893]|uniref:ROK family protein n=1 Tax=Streptomyces sp. NPDC059893 TaxID=3346990 RepID=UPI003653D7C4
MSARTASWLPLSPGERAVAIEVLTHGPLSRSEIAKRLSLSPGSLTRLTKPLIESGLLVEEATTAASLRQGRPSQPLDIVAGSQNFAGFKITGDAVYGVVTTLRSEIVARRSEPLDTHDPEGIADLLHRMTTGFQESFPRLAGIGIGVGGNVRHRATVVANAFLGWEEVPLAEMVEGRTGLPVVVDSDVAALIEAEAWFGAGRGLDRFAVLTIGAGIGYGLMLGGRLVRTGEDGHGVGKRWIINANGGPLTPEGERGSATALLTIPSICYQVRAATGRDVTYEEILAAAASGDPLCSRVIGEAARALGTLVAQIANFAMPEKILLAGEGVGLADVAGGVVHEAILANRHPMADPVPLETKVSDFHEWARGAAVLAIQVLVLGTNEG